MADDDSGEVDVDELERLLAEKQRLLAQLDDEKEEGEVSFETDNDFDNIYWEKGAGPCQNGQEEESDHEGPCLSPISDEADYNRAPVVTNGRVSGGSCISPISSVSYKDPCDPISNDAYPACQPSTSTVPPLIQRCKRSLFGSVDQQTDDLIDRALTPIKRPKLTPTMESEKELIENEIATSSDSEDDFISVHGDSESPKLLSNDDLLATYEHDSDLSDTEIERLLEDSYKQCSSVEANKPGTSVDASATTESANQVVGERYVLKHRCTEYFDVLPDGWIEVTHSSGLPVYLHKYTRVCTLSRPYFLGPGSVRLHTVPLASIPCLKQLEVQQKHQSPKLNQSTTNQESPITTNGPGPCPFSSNASNVPNGDVTNDDKDIGVKVQSFADYKKQSLTPVQLREYAMKRFEFKTFPIYKYKVGSWKQRRLDGYMSKQQSSSKFQWTSPHKLPSCTPSTSGISAPVMDRPSLPHNTKLITVPELDKDTKPSHQPFVLNPQGKSSVALLHEYIQKILRVMVKYEFGESRNAAQPYLAKVLIQSRAPHTRRAQELAKFVPKTIRDLIDRLRKEQGYDQKATNENKDTNTNVSPESTTNQSTSNTMNESLHPDIINQSSPMRSYSNRRGAFGSRRRGFGHRPYGKRPFNSRSPHKFGNRWPPHRKYRDPGVVIEDNEPMEWVVLAQGKGSSKKMAKLDAAKSAMDLLVPGIEFGTDFVASATSNNTTVGGHQEQQDQKR